MIKSTAITISLSVVIQAAGYKIPEQSLNSMALGAAYVAHTEGADTAYYNPAGMAFMEDGHFVEGGVTLAHLPQIAYSSPIPALSGHSETENMVIPYGHYVGRAIGDFRWGVSLAVPAGLTKRWETPYQKLYAEEFTLKNIELNPSLSYRVNDTFAIGGGLRVVYSQGVVNSDGADANKPLKREMEGDTVAFGYNLALLYRPTPDIHLAATYRSNIDLKEEGDANLYLGGVGRQYGADVTIPIPAALNLALSKTWNDTFTLEFDYERTFWSTYKQLDFNYDEPVYNPILKAKFDDPLDRNWKDTDTFRVGATFKVDDQWRVMAGFALDETPVPVKNIGFELPDSDAKIFSVGFRYQQNKHLSWGIAMLYDVKDTRNIPANVVDSNDNEVLNKGGSFTKGGAYLTTVGISYRY